MIKQMKSILKRFPLWFFLAFSLLFAGGIGTAWADTPAEPSSLRVAESNFVNTAERTGTLTITFNEKLDTSYALDSSNFTVYYVDFGTTKLIFNNSTMSYQGDQSVQIDCSLLGRDFSANSTITVYIETDGVRDTAGNPYWGNSISVDNKIPSYTFRYTITIDGTERSADDLIFTQSELGSDSVTADIKVAVTDDIGNIIQGETVRLLRSNYSQIASEDTNDQGILEFYNVTLDSSFKVLRADNIIDQPIVVIPENYSLAVISIHGKTSGSTSAQYDENGATTTTAMLNSISPRGGSYYLLKDTTSSLSYVIYDKNDITDEDYRLIHHKVPLNMGSEGIYHISMDIMDPSNYTILTKDKEPEGSKLQNISKISIANADKPLENYSISSLPQLWPLDILKYNFQLWISEESAYSGMNFAFAGELNLDGNTSTKDHALYLHALSESIDRKERRQIAFPSDENLSSIYQIEQTSFPYSTYVYDYITTRFYSQGEMTNQILSGFYWYYPGYESYTYNELDYLSDPALTTDAEITAVPYESYLITKDSGYMYYFTKYWTAQETLPVKPQADSLTLTAEKGSLDQGATQNFKILTNDGYELNKIVDTGTSNIVPVEITIKRGDELIDTIQSLEWEVPADLEAGDYTAEITDAATAALDAEGKKASFTVTKTYNSGGNNRRPNQPEPSKSVLFNGKSEDLGSSKITTVGGKTINTVVLDSDKLIEKLESVKSQSVITIPADKGSDTVIGELNGQTVKVMESKDSALVIETERASYTLPAKEINIQKITQSFGADVPFEKIKVRVQVAEPSDSMIKIVEDSSKSGNFNIVVPPVEFQVDCVYQGKTETVYAFRSYVSRTILIPDGVDSSKITTAIITEPDGSVRHVPTRVTVKDGKHYAEINSLTNSVYSLIWHPVEFSDTAKHWANSDINDMGSRMIVSGTGDDEYRPNQDITRAEFAAIAVRALGLKPASGDSSFSDVLQKDWYAPYVETAYENHIITGYPDGTFRPMEKITREQALAILSKAMEITALGENSDSNEINATLSEFSDMLQIADWARSNAAKCIEAGIISGKNGNRIAPKDKITRAEVAVTMKRLLEKSDLI